MISKPPLARRAIALATLLFTTLPFFARAAERPEIVAHRGASHVAPENTLASVREAWAQNANAVEVDVYLTADSRIVCFHDRELKRTTGAPGTIDASTLAELRELEAGHWKDLKWAGEPIPLLQHVLMTVPEGRRIFVEIKCGPEIVPHLAELVGEAELAAEQIAFISFDAEACFAVKRALPAHDVYLLSGFEEDEAGELRPTMPDLVARAKELGLDGLDVSYKGPLTAESVREVHGAGLFLAVYTVNDPEVARRLHAIGVDSITTDTPGEMLAQFGAAGSAEPPPAAVPAGL